MASKSTYFWGIGRRKTSVARVRLAPGSGKIIVNDKPIAEFFPILQHQKAVTSPLDDTNRKEKYDIWITVNGGGLTGQAGACRLGIARAIMVAEESPDELKKALKEKDHLTRDPRMKERKKYGQKAARARFQFSKR